MTKKLTKSQKKNIKLLIYFGAIPLLIICLFFLGMAIGYRYGGGAAGEVFSTSLWRNILLIIFG